MTPTQTKQLSTTRGVSCNISSYHWYIPGICLSYVISTAATWASAAALLLACCKSAAVYIPHIHGCLCQCAIPGEVHQHSIMQSPYTVKLHISCKFSPLCLLIWISRKWAKNAGLIVIMDMLVTTPWQSLPSVCKSPKNPCKLQLPHSI